MRTNGARCPRPAGPVAPVPRRRSRRPAAVLAARTSSPALPCRCGPARRGDGHRKRLAGERGLVDDRFVADRPPRPPARLLRRARGRSRRRRPLDRQLDELVAAAHQRRSAAPARQAWSARGARAGSRVSSSALPPASISATTAPARYSPSASAPTIETSAIASTPTSRRSSDRTTDQLERHEQHRRGRRPQPVRRLVVIAGSQRDADDDPGERGSGNEPCRIPTQPGEGPRDVVRPVSSKGGHAASVGRAASHAIGASPELAAEFPYR